VFGSLPAPAILLSFGPIAWVIGYDTIYGHQDQRDGTSWSALEHRAGRRTLAELPRRLLASAGHLAWQVWRLDQVEPALCLRLFRSNRDAGLLLFWGVLADALVRG
jgi:4-hydroxybenzoate polyprenyltransferase